MNNQSSIEQPNVKPSGLLEYFREDIKCVFERDPAARNRLEVITTYPGVHALIMHRLAHRLWCANWRYIARLIAYLSRIWTSIDIHPGAQIGRRFFIDHGVGVVIGETAVIKDHVTIYHGVTLGGVSWNQGKRHPTVENHAIIGAGAKILGPVTIGEHSRIGANSVVIKSVPDQKTMVGIPARQVNNASMNTEKSNSSHDIDLNHHLIPDPVAEAVTCLLERIRLLEQAVGVHGCLPDGQTAEDECDDCDARQVCESNQVDLKEAV